MRGRGVRVRAGCGNRARVQGGGLSAGVMRGGGVTGKVGLVLQSCRASGFWAECGNRARAQGSGPSARIVSDKVGVRVWGPCRGPGFRYECANHIGQGLGPSSGMVPGCKEGAERRSRAGPRGLGPSVGIVPGPRFWSECARRLGRGRDPGAQIVSGKVRGPDRIRCTGAGPSQCRISVSAQGSVPSEVVSLGRGVPTRQCD